MSIRSLTYPRAKRILKNHPRSLYNPDIVGNTSLHIAAEKGHLGIVQHLVEEEQHERDGVSKNNNGDTPLMLAAGEGHEEVVHCIVSRFSRCIDWRNKVGVTAMMHAAKNGCDAVVNVSFLFYFVYFIYMHMVNVSGSIDFFFF